VATIGCINAVYGSFVALAQKDLKYVIAYSSVSHMGLVMMGIATLNVVGVSGAVYQMFSHGIMTGLFFALVGLVYEKSHNRVIPEMGGFGTRMPMIAAFFTIGGLTSLGLPGLSGFVAELMIFIGTWRAFPVIAVIAMTAVVLTAIYVLRVLKTVFWGAYNKERYQELPDAAPVERVALFILSFCLLLFGLWPSLLTVSISSGVVPIINKIAATAVQVIP
jgi:NADH-quinone oxidoreductase subunit M